MAEIARSIDLDLSQRLRGDPIYRRKFFWAESSAFIAEQLIKLRKRRGLNQGEVAEKIGTKQPAISRAEQADYQNHNINTLRNIADGLDARVRVLIEPFEDIIHEYENEESLVDALSAPAQGDAVTAPASPVYGYQDSTVAARINSGNTLLPQTPPILLKRMHEFQTTANSTGNVNV
jgi:transcriptional regulator with XRE-family HTH domain